ncbi:MAG: ferredoxin--NADP reductase [bacterium]
MNNEKFTTATVIDRQNFTENLARFRFNTDEKIIFTPGQWASLSTTNSEGKIIQRPYSIASIPSDPFIEFCIECVPNGALTPEIWKLQVGDSINIMKKGQGKFTLQENPDNNAIIMLATVTGIAPFTSMIKELKSRAGEKPHCLLIHGASSDKEFGTYNNELTAIAKEGWLQYIPTVSRPWNCSDWQGETGRVDDIVRKYTDNKIFNHTSTIAYTCGNPQMIESVKGILYRANFPKEHVIEEKYFFIKSTLQPTTS